MPFHMRKSEFRGVEAGRMKDSDAPRVPIIVHPDVRRMLMTMKSYVEGMRALIYTTSHYLDMARTARLFIKNILPLMGARIRTIMSEDRSATEIAEEAL